MKFAKSIGGLLVVVAVTALLNSALTLGETRLPPLGKFTNPFHGFWISAETTDPAHHDLHLTSQALKSTVDVLFDERLVPHIFADNDLDLYYAQGYVTAMHRLFQMDMATRSAEGTLSEVIGPRTLELDRERRNQGIAWAAENAVLGWQKYPEYFELLEAYCRGVNDYISSLSPHEYPLEYKFLNFSPTPWSPYRSALFSKVMAIDLAMAESDLENTNALNLFGSEVVSELLPEQNPHQSPIIPKGTPWTFDPIPVDSLSTVKADKIYRSKFQQSAGQLGSNNWAVGPSKTLDGSVIVCSDPHLYLTLPSIWYEIHLQSNAQNCYGVSLPGIPAVVIGFNDHIAWGQTNVGQDVLDWYRIVWEDGNRQRYHLDGDLVEAEFRIEEIKIAGQDPISDTIRYTHWGPVMNSGDWNDLAMRWIVHDEPQDCEIASIVKLNKARNFEEYREALSTYTAPAQNFVFGSREGDIAITVTGKFPLRRPGQGRFVQDGSNTAHAWPGYIPFEHNPYVKNPARGFVASANQHSTDSTYPYYYSAFPYFDDYRGRYLNMRLTSLDKVTAKDMAALQFDSYSQLAADGLPVYLKCLENLDELSGECERIVEILAAWDYRYAPDAKAPYIFNLWHQEIPRRTWDEFYNLRDSIPLSVPESWKTIDLVSSQPTHSFFDFQGTDKVEVAADIVLAALEALPGMLAERDYDLTRDDKGNFLKTRLTHIGRFPGFGIELEDVYGTGSALNATGRVTGPSWRMIVTLNRDGTHAQVVYPGGQSGNPGSPYYESMVESWKEGTYHTAHFVKTGQDLEDVVKTLKFESL